MNDKLLSYLFLNLLQTSVGSTMVKYRVSEKELVPIDIVIFLFVIGTYAITTWNSTVFSLLVICSSGLSCSNLKGECLPLLSVLDLYFSGTKPVRLVTSKSY